MGADRMCMPSPTIEQFMDAIKLTVLANRRWIPPTGKGALYIRPLLVGSGAVLTLEPSSEYTFLVYVTPVGNYFKGLVPIHLLVETEVHRAAPGGTGCVKTIGNYASVMEWLVSVEELQNADEVFCTGTAVVVSPVGSVTHLGKRIEYGNEVGL